METPIGPGEKAAGELQRAVAADPENPGAWLELSWHLTAMGQLEEARQALGQHLRCRATVPALQRAASTLCAGRLAEAEFLLRDYLRRHPDEALAHHLLGESIHWRGRDVDCIPPLTRSLELDAGSLAARFTRAVAAYRAGNAELAARDVEHGLQEQPANPAYRALLAAVLSKTGEDRRTLGLYEALTAEYPNQARLWMSYGHMLKADGNQPGSVQAYRRSIALDPRLGEAWWSLANLKTVRFNEADVGEMETALRRDDLNHDERLHFEFALGKALEDLKRYESSFVHYSEGNRLRAMDSSYAPMDVAFHVRRCKQYLTREFFQTRAGVGCQAPDPIFIVGLPRAGSTLIEQILSSHSAVEGTMELPDITGLARKLAERQTDDDVRDYVHLLGDVSSAEFRAMGESFLATTRIHRKLGRPYFIDKMPNNFGHAALIHLALPNAKIIDARRHPLASCFSNFKQHFALGQLFSYGLEEIGRYYRDYVELMAHLDAVLPGRIHRVHYESMVEDTEGEVRRLLAYCGLPFEESCLRFYENDRVVRTASSEQVRRPIYKSGVDHWKHYEPWLGPLKAALGPVLDAYPQVPDFALQSPNA
jgi:tetratricopeptide (TPR) repeat protein